MNRSRGVKLDDVELTEVENRSSVIWSVMKSSGGRVWIAPEVEE